MTPRLAALLFAIGVNAAVAQTMVNFNNVVLNPPPDRLVRFTGGAPVVGTNFMAVLLYGTSESSLIAALPPARFRVPTTALPGTWQGGDRTLTGIEIPGTQVTMRVDVFDIQQFPDYAAAAAGGGILGSSALFTYLVPAPGGQFIDINNFQGFSIIPEPTVIGLCGLGAFIVWAVKRRRRD